MDDKYQVMPPLTDEEYNELKADIAERGVMVPIEFDEDGNILDGYHRYKICRELGWISDGGKILNKAMVQTVIRAGMKTDDEKFEYAYTLNLIRRHLTPEQKKNLARNIKTEHPDWSYRKIANLVGMDQEQVKLQLQDIVQLQKTTGEDGKSRPSSAEQAQQQRENIRNMIVENPDMNNHQIAQATGASDHTVANQREVVNKIVSVFKPSTRDAEALKDPDIVERMATDESLNVAGAIREQKRDQLVQHLESVETQEAKAVEGVYDVIVIDPPWPMERIESDARPHAVAMDYPVMDVEEIKAMDIPAADDCHIFLWTTQKYLPTAFDVLRAWGFKYVCTFVWHKDNGYKPFGLPKYNCEFCLYAHNGSPKFVDETQFWACFDAPITGHSEKPGAFYEMIKHVTAGRRLDMFNRRQIDGFDVWGKEAK